MRGGVFSVLITLLLLVPAAALISHGKLGKEQCSVICALCLFFSSLIAQALQNMEKGGGKKAAAMLSTLVIMTILLVFTAGIPGCSLHFSKWIIMFIAALVGSLTGSTFHLNYSYNKKQNRNKKYNRR